MPAKKPTKTSKKVIDIKSPGEVQPSATSKSIIVNNHPLAQDPMMSGDASNNDNPTQENPSDEASGAPALAVHHERKIMPLSEQPGNTSNPSDEASTKPAPTAGELVEKLEAKHAASEQVPSPGDEKPASAAVDETPAASETASPDAEVASEPSDKAPEANDSVDAASEAKSPASQAKAEADVAAATEKRLAELDEMVASEKYFVPINQVRKRHDRYWLALIIMIVLAVIVLDILFDGGYLKVSGFNFYTNLIAN